MISQTRIWLSAFLGMLLITTSIVAQADVSSTIHSTSSSVISMTTSKKLGEEIRLSIKAKGPISIDGVIETPQSDGKYHKYTFTRKTVTIRGDVTELACEDNRLTHLSFSKSDALTTLKCHNNQLTSLNLSNCMNLSYVDCSMNNIKGEAMTKLVSNLPICDKRHSSSDKEPGGRFIVVSNSPLECNVSSKLDIETARKTNWTPLKKLLVEKESKQKSIPYEGEDENLQVGRDLITMTTTKDIGKPIALALKADGGVIIEGVKESRQSDGSMSYILTNQTITIQGCVTALICAYNNLTSLDLSKNSTLVGLECSNNLLTSLDISNNSSLRNLNCRNNKLTYLDLSKNDSLVELECSNNQLTNLDVSKNTALTDLNCWWNQLTSLTVANNTSLIHLDCRGNKLTHLDVSGCTALTTFCCLSNQLKTLNMSNCTSLEVFACEWNQLSQLNLSQCASLKIVYCDENKLTSLDLSKNKALTELYCDENKLTSLDLSKNKALTTLRCTRNQLKSLNILGCDALAELFCWDNRLRSLDLSGNRALTTLNCAWNQLTNLNLSKNSALIKLDCSGNQLTSLNLSQNLSLSDIDCSGNKIYGEKMTRLVKSLPNRKGQDTGQFLVLQYPRSDQNYCLTSDVAIAKTKNWDTQVLLFFDDSMARSAYAGEER